MGRISYSQLSMYNECPMRWKLNYVDGLRISESNIHLIFGTAMHEVLQTYLEVMYNDTVKRADMLNLEEMLRDKLVEQVVDQFVDRSDVGFLKYKVTLDEERKTGIKNFADYLEDTKQELMDAILYIQSAQNSLQGIQKYIKHSKDHEED